MSLRLSPLADHHVDARLTEFNGWEMPVSFDGIRTEHGAVRDAAGKFDVSHMGQVLVSGPDAGELTQRLTTNDLAALAPGESQYTAVTREDGVMIDDTVVYRLPADFEGAYLFVPNAGNDQLLTERWREHSDRWGLQATVANRTTEYGMVALQGPDAQALLADLTAVDLTALTRFDCATGRVAGVDALVARTGYTGEDGFELLVPWAETGPVWDALDCQPCGLGARDTLRLEMGYLLSGQDFHPDDEPRTPHEAGIAFVVDMDTEFVGRDALRPVAGEGPAEKLVGLALDERGVPRTGYAVTTPAGDHLGTVTSGTMSPTLGVPIGLAYLPAAYDESGRAVRVRIRDEPKKAHTRATPFLER